MIMAQAAAEVVALLAQSARIVSRARSDEGPKSNRLPGPLQGGSDQGVRARFAAWRKSALRQYVGASWRTLRRGSSQLWAHEVVSFLDIRRTRGSWIGTASRWSRRSIPARKLQR